MKLETKIKRANILIRELVDHLEYCGWGDKWERECSEALREKADKYVDALDKDKKLNKINEI